MMILRNVKFLLSVSIVLGQLAGCATFLAGPTAPNSSLVIGRIEVDNKYAGEFFRLLPLGVLDKALNIEVESTDGKEYFKITTEEQGYFLIPNLMPNNYRVLGVIIEGHRNDGTAERHMPRLRRPTFTPAPGKITYIGTLFMDISERGEIKLREVREDDRAKSYFLQKYATSLWSAREFSSIGASGRAGTQIAQAKTPTSDVKTTALTDASVDKPDWKVGHEWRFAWKRPGTSGTLTRELVREDIIEGVPVYVMRVGKNEYSYSKESLGLLTDHQGGRLTVKRTPALQQFSWPIHVGKEWRSTYLSENLSEKSSQNLDYRMMVSNFERVVVPAGAFDAYKIDVYGFHSGNLAVEYWYSPKTRWFVKIRNHRQDGIREEELISFKAE